MHSSFDRLFIFPQVRDRMVGEGIEPLEEEIPREDVIGRSYCRYPIMPPTIPWTNSYPKFNSWLNASNKYQSRSNFTIRIAERRCSLRKIRVLADIESVDTTSQLKFSLTETLRYYLSRFSYLNTLSLYMRINFQLNNLVLKWINNRSG